MASGTLSCAAAANTAGVKAAPIGVDTPPSSSSSPRQEESSLSPEDATDTPPEPAASIVDTTNGHSQAADHNHDDASASKPIGGDLGAGEVHGDQTGQATADLGDRIEDSLLLKPYSIKTDAAAAASMITPKSLQNGGGNGSCISPLDMLIAALDPQKQQEQQQQQQQQGTAGNVVGLDASFVGGFWSPSAASCAPDQYAGIPWSSVAASGAPPGIAAQQYVADEYQLGTPGSGAISSQQMEYAEFGRNIRRGSFPPGIKRPYSDFDNLLSAADMYAATGNQQPVDAIGSAFSQHPPKHARHGSLIDIGTSSSVSAMEAAAAAAAAASISYSSVAFPCSTKRSTAPLVSPQANGAIQQQPGYFTACCFDPNTGASLPSDSSGIHPVGASTAGHHTRSLSLSARPDHPAGLMPQPLMPVTPMHSMASPMAAAVTSAAAAASYQPSLPLSSAGYFYDNMMVSAAGAAPSGLDGMGGGGLQMGGPGISSGFMMAPPLPIPSIPGVTVSPKEKPRRLSAPSFPSSDEDSDVLRPRRQKLRFAGDLYTPMWVRNNGQQKEGFCDTCAPGKWLQLKNSAFWYHKQFAHGISSVSGRPFVRPLQVRHYDADIIEGLCHQCQVWVPIANSKRRNSVLWFRHAHKCHVYHKPKTDEGYGDDQNLTSLAAATAAATAAALTSSTFTN
ncbi:hypothetical protein GGI15_004532 [Coemansia interrupta]|uniref:Transcription regulator Rua1 C-terminal domain-containing protein n=1 Tax=Coemansia interrupta TaxID=1126814 RepID=A0A9W8H6Q8_9FUNG|nr:hypothetical protein GGI15_004532 [Coemansia interrupta]